MSYKIPNTFIAGTKAVAAEVNENFEYVLNSLDEVEASLSNKITDVKSDIFELQNKDGDLIMRHNDVGAQVVFDNNTLTIKAGLSVEIPNGKSEDAEAQNSFLSYTLSQNIEKVFSTASSNSYLTINDSAEVFEYLSYIEAEAEPEGAAPILFYNTLENKMYKKMTDEETFQQCFEAVIADGFTRGEEGTITALNSLIPPVVVLIADTIHTAAIKVNTTLLLPELQSGENYINTMLEFTIEANCSLTLPNNIKYSGGEAPELVADGITINRLIFDTTTGGQDWICYFSSTGS